MKKSIRILLTLFCLLSAGMSGHGTTAASVKFANDDANSLDSRLGNLVRQISAGLTENQKQRIAVVEFADLKGNITDFGRYLAEELITRLFQTGKIKVIERQLLNRVIAEQKLSLTGVIEPSSAQKLGRLLGVDSICAGSISDLGKSLKINARLISTETAEVFSVAATEVAKDESVCALGGCSAANASTQSSPVNDTNAPPPAFKPIRAMSTYFTFDLKGCYRKNTSVVCEITVVNNDTDRKFIIGGGPYTSIRVFDDANTEHRARWVDLASRGKREWDSLTLLNNVPVNISIGLDNLNDQVSKFTLLQLIG
jgi:curli biogenesis system outer membrane secretion channel CsgG